MRLPSELTDGMMSALCKASMSIRNCFRPTSSSARLPPHRKCGGGSMAALMPHVAPQPLLE